jgi:hypothetical protein
LFRLITRLIILFAVTLPADTQVRIKGIADAAGSTPLLAWYAPWHRAPLPPAPSPHALPPPR